LALLRRLVRDEGVKHIRAYAFAIACMAVAAGATGFAAYLLKDVVNQIFVDRDPAAIYGLGALIVVIYLVKGLSSYGSDVTMARIGGWIIAGVQNRMFNHLLMQGLPFFSDNHSTEFLAQNAFVASSARSSLTLVVTTIGQVLSVIALATVMIRQDSLLAVSALIFMPCAVLGSRYLSKRVRTVGRRQYDDFRQIMSIMQETAQGVRVVKAFGLEDAMRERMAAAIGSFRRGANKIAELGSRSGPIMETIAGFAVATVVVYGGWRVIHGGKTPGELISFLGALMLAYDPAKRLAKMNVDLNSALVGVKMYYEFIDRPGLEDAAAQSAEPLRLRGGKIEFDNVVFGYRPDEPVLRGTSLTADAGVTTALVGQSGGGKSTILGMILRFYEPTSGRISIDGQDIANVSLVSLRAATAYVGQDVFLFAGSIRENIAFGHFGASEERIIAASKAAHAHDFIRGFELGYDTPVGERGLALSGGQRARIAIARAILKDAAIILLDEATAALDSESEMVVQTALDELCANRTVLVIAHRLQTIQRADKICVVEGGQIVEEGRHEELLARRGRYFFLHAIQFRDEPARPAA
jgi:ATP-binding cassette subfamily B protein